MTTVVVQIIRHTDVTQPGWVECEREIITIDTELLDHIEATTGTTRFDVLPVQLGG